MNDTNAVKVYTPEDDFGFVRSRDVVTPRLFLLQPMSQPVVENKFRAGEFVMNDGGVIAPGAKAKFVVLMMWLQWIEWHPDRDVIKEERMIAKSFDPMSALAKRAEKWELVKNKLGKEVPAVTEYYNCIIALPGVDNNYSNLATFGFARSSHKIGKIFINRMMGIKYEGRKPHMWETEFEISSKMETKGNDRFYVPVIGAANRLPTEYIEEVRQNAETLRARREEMINRVAAQEQAEDETEGGPTVNVKSADQAPF